MTPVPATQNNSAWSAGRAESPYPARTGARARRGERLAPGRPVRACRADVRRELQRMRLSCLLKRLNLSRQKTRPSHPKGDPAAQAAFKKGAPSMLKAIAAKHPEARFSSGVRTSALGEKGRTTRGGMSAALARVGRSALRELVSVCRLPPRHERDLRAGTAARR